MIANGVPKENVILMMQDDVANAAGNPYPGKLFNKPTAAGVAGADVYETCAPDYTGSVVDAGLFLDVLTGNSSDPSRHKVLKSGPNDKVRAGVCGGRAGGQVAKGRSRAP